MAPPIPPVAILGGSFDPITLGHVSVLVQAAEALGAEEGWILPARSQPLRSGSHAAVDARVELARAAVAGRRDLRVVETEARRAGPSYTMDTLDELEGEYPGREFWWVMGPDVARSIRRWHRSAELLGHGRFAVVNRSGVTPLGADEAVRLGFHPARTRMLTVDSPLVSSTEVRDRLGCRLPVEALVGTEVARLIATLGLYGPPSRGPVPAHMP